MVKRRLKVGIIEWVLGWYVSTSKKISLPAASQYCTFGVWYKKTKIIWDYKGTLGFW